jgi:alkanesulfonate monooxygenase SsuD/methylene tetrahydromethanopterin reductase-like flavin-dependent oxidoreductase (luciferase family)
MPLLRGETVVNVGDRVTTTTPLPLGIPGASAPPVLVAALGTLMLKLAGTVADGTVTWMTGVTTIESHIVPTIRAAAEAAGRPEPRVGVSLPVCVTGDIAAAKERINAATAIYPTLPSYKAMLDKEGAESAGDIAFVGDEESVAASVARLAEAGATDFVCSIIGDAAERERSFVLMRELARS